MSDKIGHEVKYEKYQAFNPINPRDRIEEEELQELEELAKEWGVGAIGYTKLEPKLIFKKRAVLYENVIVLLLEMDKNKMELAPSKETAKMIMETYDALGIATNKLTKYLRDKGFAAQASHPLGGIVLYPPLAEKAGLGYHGSHGLLITPEFGPQVRLAAIFTNINNLPVHKIENPHSWIAEFCKKCHRCIRKCPSWAIYDEPIMNNNGLLTHIDNTKCFPVFLDYHSCSICIKECTFNEVSYSRLKKKFDKEAKSFTSEEIDNMVEQK
ncbi:MAG: 4Fe-4S dicluster domain-containing protein [Candidatus Hodarchaeales archaeon]